MPPTGIYRFEGVTVDLAAMRVFQGADDVALEPKSLQVLVYLVEHPGRLVRKEELMEAIWPDTFVGENSLTRAVAQIRKSLGDDAKQGRYIETVPKLGYRFIAEVRKDGIEPAGQPQAAAVPETRKSRAAMWVALGVGVLAIGAGAAWHFQHRAEEMSLPQPLTSYQGSQDEPSFSPDGSQVAFQWNGEKGDNWDIYVKVLGSEAPLRLTTNPAQDIFPQWSPDGRTIAFVRTTQTGNFDLMLIPALGGPERKLGEFSSVPSSRGFGFGCVPDWSPDSKWLIIPSTVDSGSEQALFKVSIETAEASQITEPGPTLADSWPEISPDGTALIFTRRHLLSVGDLYGVALDANANPKGQPRRIPLGPNLINVAKWMPDGRSILAAGPRGYWRVPAEGSDTPERIAWLGDDAGVFATSKNAGRLAYTVIRGDANIWRIDLREKAVHPERLIASTYRDVYPQYSPDGSRVAFYSNRGGSAQVWVSNADGSQARQLTSVRSGIAGTPHWSPDGKTLAFDSNERGTYQVFTMSSEGGKIAQLTQPPSTNFAATWSRDGRWIYFSSNRTGRNEVWKMPEGGGPPTQVTHSGGVKAIESFDAQTIYFSKEDGSGSIWKTPAAGGPETKLADSLFRFNFAVTHQGIYYMTPMLEDGTAMLKFYNFATAGSTTVAPMGRPEFGLDVSPDGRYLIYAQMDNLSSNLMLVENFR